MSHVQHEFPVPPKVSLWSRIWAAFTKAFPDTAGKQLAVWVLALIGFAAVWIWGWMVGGGLTRIVGAIPSGAVVAFAKECPKELGWREHSAAIGRFIIGVGTTDVPWQRVGPDGKWSGDLVKLTSHTLAETGGEENHILTVGQLPSHNHNAYRATGNGDGLYPKAEVMGPRSQAIAAPTQDAGGNQPHNIMPPFIALHYCEKQ
jgi:hypothetical protein